VLQLSRVAVVSFSSMFHSTNASYNTSEITSAVCGAGTYMNLYANRNKKTRHQCCFLTKMTRHQCCFLTEMARHQCCFLTEMTRHQCSFLTEMTRHQCCFLREMAMHQCCF
jgi:uncharacterized membrane protein YeiB